MLGIRDIWIWLSQNARTQIKIAILSVIIKLGYRFFETLILVKKISNFTTIEVPVKCEIPAFSEKLASQPSDYR